MAMETQVLRDLNARTITVIREFEAPVELVWRAYTEAELLDQWWGPLPWRAETKSMDFRPGGTWLYSMVGPQSERHWCRMDYTAIDTHKSFNAKDGFCDENGNTNPELPVSNGQNVFSFSNGVTRVEWKTTYESEEAVMTMVNMGMEQGIRICIEQLVLLLLRLKNS